MSTHTLTIPAPCEWINANMRSGSWHKKANLTRQWRNAAHVAALQAHLPRIDVHVRIVAHIHKATSNAYDSLNYADTAKAAVDGLRDAGVLIDDSNKYVTGPDMRPGARAERAHLILTITEIDPNGKASA